MRQLILILLLLAILRWGIRSCQPPSPQPLPPIEVLEKASGKSVEDEVEIGTKEGAYPLISGTETDMDAGDLMSVKNEGWGKINLIMEGRDCLEVNVYKHSELAISVCEPTERGGINISCVRKGIATFHNQCHNKGIRIHTAGSKSELLGTWLFVAHLPATELTLVAVVDGDVEADALVNFLDGQSNDTLSTIGAGYFWYSYPEIESSLLITDLNISPPYTNTVYPLSYLPIFIEHAIAREKEGTSEATAYTYEVWLDWIEYIKTQVTLDFQVDIESNDMPFKPLPCIVTSEIGLNLRDIPIKGTNDSNIFATLGRNSLIMPTAWKMGMNQDGAPAYWTKVKVIKFSSTTRVHVHPSIGITTGWVIHGDPPVGGIVTPGAPPTSPKTGSYACYDKNLIASLLEDLSIQSNIQPPTLTPIPVETATFTPVPTIAIPTMTPVPAPTFTPMPTGAAVYTLSAVPTAINQGQTVVLKYKIENIDSAYLTGEGIKKEEEALTGSGEKIVRPDKTTEYTLSVLLRDKTTTITVPITVIVNPTPTPSPTLTPTTTPTPTPPPPKPPQNVRILGFARNSIGETTVRWNASEDATDYEVDIEQCSSGLYEFRGSVWLDRRSIDEQTGWMIYSFEEGSNCHIDVRGGRGVRACNNSRCSEWVFPVPPTSTLQ